MTDFLHLSHVEKFSTWQIFPTFVMWRNFPMWQSFPTFIMWRNFPLDNMSWGEFLHMNNFSPQTPSAMSVTNIRYGYMGVVVVLLNRRRKNKWRLGKPQRRLSTFRRAPPQQTFFFTEKKNAQNPTIRIHNSSSSPQTRIFGKFQNQVCEIEISGLVQPGLNFLQYFGTAVVHFRAWGS